MTFSQLVLPKCRRSARPLAGVAWALPRSLRLEFGDQLVSGEQAGAIPPDAIAVPAGYQAVFRALGVGFKVVHVSAGGRENVAGRGASIPGLVAVFETRLAAIGAIAAGSLE